MVGAICRLCPIITFVAVIASPVERVAELVERFLLLAVAATHSSGNELGRLEAPDDVVIAQGVDVCRAHELEHLQLNEGGGFFGRRVLVLKLCGYKILKN